VNTHMHRQTALQLKLLIAHGARKRFLGIMRIHVIGQLSLLLETFLADGALEWFLTRMNSHMLGQAAALIERLVAMRTSEGLLACMRAQMDDEVAALFEGLGTVAADVVVDGIVALFCFMTLDSLTCYRILATSAPMMTPALL